MEENNNSSFSKGFLWSLVISIPIWILLIWAFIRFVL